MQNVELKNNKQFTSSAATNETKSFIDLVKIYLQTTEIVAWRCYCILKELNKLPQIKILL